MRNRPHTPWDFQIYPPIQKPPTTKKVLGTPWAKIYPPGGSALWSGEHACPFGRDKTDRKEWGTPSHPHSKRNCPHPCGEGEIPLSGGGTGATRDVPRPLIGVTTPLTTISRPLTTFQNGQNFTFWLKKHHFAQKPSFSSKIMGFSYFFLICKIISKIICKIIIFPIKCK